MINFIYQWIDVLWLGAVFFAVHKPHRLYALGFILSCMFMMRLQIEMMSGIGYEQGILAFMDSHIHVRLMVIYSIVYILYFVMAYYSPNTKGAVFLAASISVFFFALFLSIFLMVL